MSASAAHRSFADPPDAALACILQQLQLRQRLSRCALVCRSWAAAAASVPAHVDVELSRSGKLVQLQAWLGSCWAAQVTSLHWAGNLAISLVPLQLPCHKLRKLTCLQLEDFGIEELQHGGVSTTLAGAAPAAVLSFPEPLLPSLRELRLTGCNVRKQQLLQLAQLTGLTQLHLSVDVRGSRWAQLAGAESSAAVAQLLGGLPGLSELKLAQPNWEALMNSVSAMQHLQHLHITRADCDGTDALATLPLSLTGLHFEGTSVPHSGVTAAAQLSRLTHLQRLSAKFIYVHPGVLSGLTWLRDLRLWVPYTHEPPSASAAPLLAALGRLTQLQHLELRGCALGEVQPRQQQEEQQEQQEQPEEDGYQCFSALTASSQLTALHIGEAFGSPLPSPAALDQMLPPGRVLSHLRSLQLQNIALYEEGCCVDAAQIPAIARSCPALTQLVLKGVTPPDFDAACLEQLPPGVTAVEGLDWQRPVA